MNTFRGDVPRRMHRFSQIDFRSVDALQLNPELRDVTVFSARVLAGETLFIPLAWFHDVVSLRFIPLSLFTVFLILLPSSDPVSRVCVSFNLFLGPSVGELERWKWLRLFADD